MNLRYLLDDYETDISEVSHNKKYGFVEIENPHYGMDYADNFDDDIDYTSKFLIRKPSPSERREIVVNTIIQRNEKPIAIKKLAELLAVSERTLQSVLRGLESESIIQIIPRHDKNGAQKSSIYKYIGSPCKKYGSGLDLGTLYGKNNVGFRTWSWKALQFSHNGKWHDLNNQVILKFQSRLDRRQYLEANNLPLVTPDDVKFLVLRYSYWKDTSIKTYTIDSVANSEKIKIDAEQQYKILHIHGYNLLLWFTCNENIKVRIYDLNTHSKVATFSWFSANVLNIYRWNGKKPIENLHILGDFTTK